MKLLLITAIHEFENDVKHILSHSGVQSFSYQYVKGYKSKMEDDSENWFGSTHHMEVDSVLFTVFVDQILVQNIYEKIQNFNARLTEQSHIHVATLLLENSM